MAWERTGPSGPRERSSEISSYAIDGAAPHAVSLLTLRKRWVAIVIALFIGLRLQEALQLPIALFIVTMVTVAEAWLSTET